MELRHLRYFVAVAAQGSFNRAAERLHLTQPTLSRQVQDLEEELGVVLVTRRANSVMLTAAGESFHEEARDILAQVDQAVKRVRGGDKYEALRIGYIPSLTGGAMPRAIGRFHAAAPRVRLELSDLSPREMIGLAFAGQLDLVVTLDATADFAAFSWTELHRVPPALVMSRSHPLAKLKKVPPGRLHDVTLHYLNHHNYPEYAPLVRAMLKPFGIKPRVSPDNAEGLIPLFAALEGGDGAAILPEGVDRMIPQSLVTRPFSPPPRPFVGKMGMRKSNPHAEIFARLLVEETKCLRAGRP
jgi:LysR family hca operon transcriptional activator